MEFGVRLKIIRKSKGFSQSDISKKLGIAQNTYSGWESGKALPNVKYICLLCTLLDVPADYLLFD